MIDVSNLKKISEKTWFYPVALLLIGLISYGYALTSLGYYWADWEIVMFTKLNPSLQFGYYAGDRPFPWTYQLIYILIGSNPIGWHIVTLLIRWLGTLFFVNALILLWPRYKKHMLWLGALLIVYPGFLQQSQSATKARHIMTLLLFALSIYLMALAVRRPKWNEFFSHSLGSRPSPIFLQQNIFPGSSLYARFYCGYLFQIAIKEDLHILRRVVITSLPYLLITAFFFWCRFVYFPDIFETTSRFDGINSTLSEFQGSFVGSFLGLFDRALLDLIYATLQVWVNAIIHFDGFTFQGRTAWFAFGLGVLLAVVFAFFHDTNEEETPDNAAFPASVFIVGLVSFVLSALPIWAIGKEISTGGWNDRFALAPMLGACLMVVALLLWFVRPAGQKLILGFLLIFSIATQVWVVNTYRRDWGTQLDYYWQLHWRAPALQAGTAVFSFELPSSFVSHATDASYAINVLYHYQTEDGSLPYWFITPENQIYFQPNMEFKNRKRNLEFNGSTSAAVAVLHQTGDSCLRVLDEVYLYDPLLHDGHDRLFPVSNLSRIIPDPSPVPPDKDIFGPEPAHEWCYFFEKADLARQTEDWNKVLALYEQAQQQGIAPGYGAEYIPFIEAYAQTGDWQKAYKLTIAAQELSPRHKRMLCANWIRLSTLPSTEMIWFEKIDQAFSC